MKDLQEILAKYVFVKEVADIVANNRKDKVSDALSKTRDSEILEERIAVNRNVDIDETEEEIDVLDVSAEFTLGDSSYIFPEINQNLKIVLDFGNYEVPYYSPAGTYGILKAKKSKTIDGTVFKEIVKEIPNVVVKKESYITPSSIKDEKVKEIFDDYFEKVENGFVIRPHKTIKTQIKEVINSEISEEGINFIYAEIDNLYDFFIRNRLFSYPFEKYSKNCSMFEGDDILQLKLIETLMKDLATELKRKIIQNISEKTKLPDGTVIYPNVKYKPKTDDIPDMLKTQVIDKPKTLKNMENSLINLPFSEKIAYYAYTPSGFSFYVEKLLEGQEKKRKNNFKI